MQRLNHGAFRCEWFVHGASRCGYRSMKGNVRRHIRVVHLGIRFVALLSHHVQDRSLPNPKQAVHLYRLPPSLFQQECP